MFGLCVGYADPATPTAIKPRLPQSVVLGTDTYRAVGHEVIRGYDRVMTEFYQEQSMDVPGGGWSKHCAERVRTPAALSGRHRLLEALKGRGFDLR